MPTVSDVDQALRVADSLPPGEEQVERSEQALALAEQVGDFTLLVQARINLVAAYDVAAPGDRELPHIAWLLGRLEGDPDGPDQVTDRQRLEILWECRFALARSLRSSRMPLEDVQRVYHDIESRFRAEDVSPHLYAKYRAFLARDIDTDEVLERWLGVWRGSPSPPTRGSSPRPTTRPVPWRARPTCSRAASGATASRTSCTARRPTGRCAWVGSTSPRPTTGPAG